jgi:hypothetical protein
MTDTHIKAGFIWRRNIRTVHSDGSVTEGGYVAVRPARLIEALLYHFLGKEPTP